MRGMLAIEHVMPRKWQTFWPLEEGQTEAERDRLVHTLGNLTLLTSKLNSKVSNAGWNGEGGKRGGLAKHSILLLTHHLLEQAPEKWSEDAIRSRTKELTETIIKIWPVPPDHRSGFVREEPRIGKRVDLNDLIAGNALHPGMALFPRRKKFSHKVATLLADGRLEVDGTAYARPSEAAAAITGKPTNGWGFFLTDQQSRRSLRMVRREYVDAMAVEDANEDDLDDDGDEDESSRREVLQEGGHPPSVSHRTTIHFVGTIRPSSASFALTAAIERFSLSRRYRPKDPLRCEGAARQIMPASARWARLPAPKMRSHGGRPFNLVSIGRCAHHQHPRCWGQRATDFRFPTCPINGASRREGGAIIPRRE